MTDPSAAVAGDPSFDYLARCRQSDSALLTCISSLPAEAEHARRFLPRPIFRRHQQLLDLGADIVALLRLVESLPDRFFNGSVAQFLEAQGQSPKRSRLIRAGSVGTFFHYGRPDAIACRGEFKLIELNVGSDVGGIPMVALNHALLEHQEFSEFAAAHGLWWIDTLAVLIEQLREVAASVTGTDDPMIAIVEETNSGRECQGLADAMTRAGARVLLGELSDLSLINGKIAVDGRAVEVVVRYFGVSHLLRESDGEAKMAMLAEAHRNGKTAYFTPMDSAVYESKAVLGLLFEESTFSQLEANERDLVERRIPRTRLISRTLKSSDLSGQFLQECVQRRKALVLKPAFGSGGSGVRVGANMSPSEWTTALGIASEHDYVVQERVVSDPEEIIDPLSGETEQWKVNWGVFAGKSGYAGCYARAIRGDDKDIIRRDNSGTRFGPVFTY
jgi:hypothetical protein